jgi:hypothetical protein
MRFIFAVAGWSGFAYDPDPQSCVGKFSFFPVPPKEKYYLLESGYPNQIGYLVPFKGSAYHIPEFQLRSARPL